MKLTLNGTVVGDDDKWLYDWFNISAFSPRDVREALAELPFDEPLELEVNSGGGSVWAGFEIYSILRQTAADTVAVVQSLAASAASTIICGAKHVKLSPVAQVMIHLPMTTTTGNRDDHRDSIKVLDSIEDSILNGYVSKCGGKTTRDELRRMLHNSTWLSAEEAVNIGLADEILYTDGESEATIAGIVNSCRDLNTLFNSCGFSPCTADLLKRYEHAVRNGAAPAEGHPVNPVPLAADAAKNTTEDWTLRARLNLEKLRY